MKTFKLTAFIVSAFLMLPFAALSQSKFLKTEEQTKTLTEEFAKSIMIRNVEHGIKAMKPYSSIPAETLAISELQSVQEAYKLLQNFGTPKELEFIETQRVGENLIKHKFFILCEKAPLRVSATYYKSENGWIAVHFGFDGNIAAYF